MLDELRRLILHPCRSRMLDQLYRTAYEAARNKPTRRISRRPAETSENKPTRPSGRLVKRISSCGRRLDMLADWLLRRWPSNTHERSGSFSWQDVGSATAT